ncbi:MAG: HD domain-containing protein [Thermodesulfobacteriota bacterium]
MNGNDARPAHTLVKDLKAGSAVVQFFQIRSKEARKTRGGQDYVDLVLGDKSGTISAKMWSDVIRKWGHEFGPGDFVRVDARVETYLDQNQMVVDKIRKAEPTEIPDISLLVRTCAEDPQKLLEVLKGVIASLEPQSLAELVDAIIDRHADAFTQAPAAKMIHHAYRGGLIEHTVSVVRKVEAILPLEKGINRNIALAGAILHDIGKCRELALTSATRTFEGKLVGHIVLGIQMLQEAAMEKGVAEEIWLRELEHVMLAHHGEGQFGSPVRPMTREAVLVHFVDNLDSKLKIVEEALETADADGFTPYNKWMEGRLFAGSHAVPQGDEQ